MPMTGGFYSMTTITAKVNAKPRDFLFDNYRALLILLVVAGHFIETIYRNNWLLEGLKWIIYAFHVPAFVFISGYFSKKKTPFLALCKKVAVPYLVFEVLYYLLYTYVTHKETKLYLMHPKFTLWYLMALFFWKFATPYFRKIPGCLPLSILMGLAIGFSPMKDNYLTIPRALVFYPYFLAGVMLEKDTVANLRSKRIGNCKLSTLCALAFGIAAVLLLIWGHKLPGSPTIFYGRYSYATLKQTAFLGVFIRLFTYLIGFTVTYGLLTLLPGKEYKFSFVGQKTLQIYLFHGLIYKTLEAFGFMKLIQTIPQTILFLGFLVLLTGVLAAKPFTWLLKILCLDISKSK